MGDFEAHISRFSEYALSDATVGFSDSCFGVFVYELGRARDEAEFLLVDDRSLCPRTTTFEPVPLDFHLYSMSLIRTDPLSERRDWKGDGGVVKT